jgi:uncharacterized repeat protein (TIGR01451 family)
MIGGTDPGAGNIIAFNGSGLTLAPSNVAVSSNSVHDAILSNLIYSGGSTDLKRIGIDLNNDGVTQNTPGGPHTGANDLQNFPVLTSATSDGISSTTINGTFNSTPNHSFLIQFFSSIAPDPSGYGEARVFLGSTTVMTDGSGNATFSATLSIGVGARVSITSTATDVTVVGSPPAPVNDTSEFSADIPVVVTGTADLSIGILATPNPVIAGNPLTYSLTVTNHGPNTATEVVLSDELPNGVTFVSANPSQGTAAEGGGLVVANLGAINSGASATMTVVVTPNFSGNILDTARVFADQADPNFLDNTISASTTVQDADAGVLQLALASITVAENAGSVMITVNRVSGTNGAVSVHFATSDGTAIMGTNYAATSGNLNFAAGDTSKTFSIPIFDDRKVLGNQTFTLALSAPTGGSSLGTPVAATITLTEVDRGRGSVSADYNGDGRTDIGVYGPYGPNGVGRIAVLLSGGGSINMPFGGPLDQPISGDFDGDGKTDIGVWGPYGPGGAERFAIQLSGGGSIVQTLGGPLDKPVIGAFDGDGKADLGVYGPYGPGGQGRLLVVEPGGGVIINRAFGGPLDTFVAGDFDGDGKTDIAVYGPYGPNGLNRFAIALSGGGSIVQTIGGPLDQPVSGDFNGDGKTDIGVFGPYGPNGLNRLAVMLSGGGSIVQTFGGPLDRFVSGDFDGDGKTDIAVYGPYGPNGVGRLAVVESSGGAINLAFGGPQDTPLPPPITTPFVSRVAIASAPGSGAPSLPEGGGSGGAGRAAVADFVVVIAPPNAPTGQDSTPSPRERSALVHDLALESLT